MYIADFIKEQKDGIMNWMAFVNSIGHVTRFQDLAIPF